jgi:hypothetical protein
MNLRILLIVGLLVQAITVQRACVSMECAEGKGARVEIACCSCAGAAACERTAPEVPCDEPCRDEGLCCCCCFCVGLRDAPGVLVSQDRDAGPPAVDAAWIEPFSPILASVRVGPVPPTARPDPPGATLRRAILCCWTI